MRTVLLVDADILAYGVAARSQRSYAFPGLEDPAVALDDPDELLPALQAALTQWTGWAKKDPRIVICLSCPSAEGWRRKVLPSYKANRNDVVKPEYLAQCKALLAEHYETFERPTLEADDVMGILSTHPTLMPGRRVIVSSDKDMKTIPGWLFNPSKDRAPRLVSEAEADYWHLYQALVGDTTDGYRGCPGVGPVKAQKALHAPNGERLGEVPAWQAVVACYETKKLTEADALVQARVARICRHTDYDFNTKKVILWTPPA